MLKGNYIQMWVALMLVGVIHESTEGRLCARPVSNAEGWWSELWEMGMRNNNSISTLPLRKILLRRIFLGSSVEPKYLAFAIPEPIS
jgi:hypothetical protein